MRSRMPFFKTIIISVLFNTLLINYDAIAALDCGTISQIWHYGLPLIPNQESKLLEVYRNNKRIKAKVGILIKKGDRIQAKASHVEFEITWYGEKDKSLFKASENEPIHVRIKQCLEKTILESFSDIISIITSGKLFEVETEPAIAGTPGTNFQIKLEKNGQEAKLIVTKGEAYLKNKYGQVTVKESEVGTAKKGHSPTKIHVDKDYISKEVQWLFNRTGLSQTYATEFGEYATAEYIIEKGGKLQTPPQTLEKKYMMEQERKEIQ